MNGLVLFLAHAPLNAKNALAKTQILTTDQENKEIEGKITLILAVRIISARRLVVSTLPQPFPGLQKYIQQEHRATLSISAVARVSQLSSHVG